MTLREADELGTETEAGTLACRNTNRGGEEVEDGEDDGGEDRTRFVRLLTHASRDPVLS